jgi:hypothetical protein
MNFPTPVPLESEYPAILKWCDPSTVLVTDVDAVSEGAEEVEDEAVCGGSGRPAAAPAGEAEEGPPRQTRPAPIDGRDRARVPTDRDGARWIPMRLRSDSRRRGVDSGRRGFGGRRKK